MYIVLLLLLPVHCISFKIQHLQLISWLDCRVLAMRSFCCCPSLHRHLCSACLRWNRHSVRSKITGQADIQDHGINQISPPRKRSTTNGQLSSKIHFFFKDSSQTGLPATTTTTTKNTKGDETLHKNMYQDFRYIICTINSALINVEHKMTL